MSGISNASIINRIHSALTDILSQTENNNNKLRLLVTNTRLNASLSLKLDTNYSKFIDIIVAMEFETICEEILITATTNAAHQATSI